MAREGGNFRFTGNPKIVQYKPRGLDYFTYLPQLKAQIKASALNVANSQLMDATGVAPQDLNKIHEMTGFINNQTEGIVDKLMTNQAVDDTIVSNLTNLSRQKMDADSKIKSALFNAKQRMQFHSEINQVGRATGDFEFSNAIIKKTDQDWGGTFAEDGSIREFTPFTRDYVDVDKEIEEYFKTAAGNLTLSDADRTQLGDVQFFSKMEPDPSGSGKLRYKVGTSIPDDILKNHSALGKALTHIETQLNDKESRWGSYTDFMNEYADKDYKHRLVSSLNGRMEAWKREQHNKSGINASTGFENPVPDSGGSGMAVSMVGIADQANLANFNQLTVNSFEPLEATKSLSEVRKTQDKTNELTNVYRQYHKQASRNLDYFLGSTMLSPDEISSFLNAGDKQSKYAYNPIRNAFLRDLNNGDTKAVKLNESLLALNNHLKANSSDEEQTILLPVLTRHNEDRAAAIKKGINSPEYTKFKANEDLIRLTDDFNKNIVEYTNSKVKAKDETRNVQVYDINYGQPYVTSSGQVIKTDNYFESNIKESVLEDVRTGQRDIVKITIDTDTGTRKIESSGQAWSDTTAKTAFYTGAVDAINKGGRAPKVLAKGETVALFGNLSGDDKKMLSQAKLLDQGYIISGAQPGEYYIVQNKEEGVTKRGDGFIGTGWDMNTKKDVEMNLSKTITHLKPGQKQSVWVPGPDGKSIDIEIGMRNGLVYLEGTLEDGPIVIPKMTFTSKAAAIDMADRIYKKMTTQ